LNKVTPTKEQIRKTDNIYVLEETIKAGIRRLRNRGSTVYDRYYARNQINADMHNAANLYYTHYFLGHERTSTIVKYGERLGEGSIPALTNGEYQEHHRDIYNKARTHIKTFNPKLATFIDDVILYDVDLRTAAKTIRHQPENGYSLFCVTLESLVDFFF